MKKIQIIWLVCITTISILFYSAIWVNSNITLSEKFAFSGGVLFLQSSFSILTYDSYN